MVEHLLSMVDYCGLSWTFANACFDITQRIRLSVQIDRRCLSSCKLCVRRPPHKPPPLTSLGEWLSFARSCSCSLPQKISIYMFCSYNKFSFPLTLLTHIPLY